MRISSYHQLGGGGINNQKMAIIGAIVHAYEQGISFALPKISEMDQLNKNYEKYDYKDIFEEKLIIDVLGKYNINLVPFVQDAGFDITYEDCFWKTFHLFESKAFLAPDAKGTLVFDLIRSFVPHVIKTRSYGRLKEAIYNRDGEIIFCQFRIEQDWITHCKNEIVKVRSPVEELYVDYMTICMKIVNTFPQLRNIFICADEPSMPSPKSVIKRDIWKTFGLRAIFKSDFLGSEGEDHFRSNEYSLIDMALCVDSGNFVGTTRSTFSNMIALQRFCTNTQSEQTFVYNHKSIYLKQRMDSGASAGVEQSVKNTGHELIVKDKEIVRLVNSGQRSFFQLKEGTHILFDKITYFDEEIEFFGVKLDNIFSLDGDILIRKENVVIL